MRIEPEHSALLDPAAYEREILNFLQAYRYDGPRPSLDHVRSIAQFYSRLPYENISKILKRAHHPDGQLFRLPEELLEDHYRWHAGGTCFSLSYLLLGIYRILGYEVEALLADLNWGSNNHSAILLHFSGQRFIVDPGYMIFKPLPLTRQHVQSQISAETGLSLRYDAARDSYSLYTFRKKQFVRRYSFSPRPVSLEVFAKYWKASFDLPGMDDLILNRVEGYEMTFIQGDFIKITSPNASAKYREATLVEDIIQNKFQIPLEKLEEARYLLRQRGSQDEG